MKRVLLALLLLLLAAPGCRNRGFINGGGFGGNEAGVAIESVDRYAKQHGLTREEALRQIRQQQRELAEEAVTEQDAAGPTPPTTADSETDAQPPLGVSGIDDE